jgi:acyl carrier protein
MKTVLELLQEIRPELDFAASSDFIEQGMLDSFDLITLVAALEQNFAVTIAGAAIVPENFRSVASIESLVENSRG